MTAHPLELVPAGEPALIAQLVQHTVAQMKKRYEGAAVQRGVHPKDHGCVSARFQVHTELPEALHVGVFARPGHTYDAWIRFSNAALRAGPDSERGADGVVRHSSRGMAVKLLGVTGQPLVSVHGGQTQDFLMVNDPVFPFSNVEDYLALNDAISQDGDDKPERFFARMKSPDEAIARRARASAAVLQRIRSAGGPCPSGFRYFSGSPFLFGEDRVMKFSAKPRHAPSVDLPEVTDHGYLRKALHQRLTLPGAKDLVFDFQVQIRHASEVGPHAASEIEDACCEWSEQKHPFGSVATGTIPPQDFYTNERRALCESQTFTPWHGLSAHRPLGGINRLRLAVYEASAQLRHMPPEPVSLAQRAC